MFESRVGSTGFEVSEVGEGDMRADEDVVKLILAFLLKKLALATLDNSVLCLLPLA